jgi:hypothetical protein
MSLVPHIRANRVGVGVLGGAAPADQHAGASRRGQQRPPTMASDHDAGRRPPSSSRTRGGDPVADPGVGERPAALVAVPLLVDLGSSPARRRSTTPRRWSVRWAQPDAQCSHTLGLDTRSKGRPGTGRRRRSGRPPGRSARCCRRSTSRRPRRGDADLLQRTAFQQFDERVAGDLVGERVQRAHSTQRSRSSRTCADRLIGLGKVRLTSSKRVSTRPLDIAWFCSGHSPPLSQTGQSSGWLISSSSITPCWALSAAARCTGCAPPCRR